MKIFNNLFSSFLSRKGLLIEINENLFKIATMKIIKNKVFIENLKVFTIKNKGLRKKQIKQEMIKYVEKNNLKLKNNNVFTTVEDEKNLFIQTINVPGKVKKKNLPKTIKTNLNNYLPFQKDINVDNYNYDYHVTKKEKNYDIILATIKKNAIKQYSDDLFLSQDNNFYNIYIKPFVLFNALKSINKHETSAILNFSKAKTHLVIATNGNYKFHKTIDVGKNDFLKILSKKSSVEISEIEVDTNYFKNKKNETIDYDYDLRNIIEDDMQIKEKFFDTGDELLQEIDMSMAYFNNKFNESIDKLYFVENQKKLPGLYDYLKNNLNLLVSTIDNELLNIESEEPFQENAVLFSTAISAQE
jgi:Tfp pilus assembly PilM family ATPase